MKIPGGLVTANDWIPCEKRDSDVDRLDSVGLEAKCRATVVGGNSRECHASQDAGDENVAKTECYRDCHFAESSSSHSDARTRKRDVGSKVSCDGGQRFSVATNGEAADAGCDDGGLSDASGGETLSLPNC